MTRVLVLFLLVFSLSVTTSAHESYAKARSSLIKTNGSEEFVQNFNNARGAWKKNRGKKLKDFSRSDANDMRTQGDQMTKSLNKKKRSKKQSHRYMRGRNTPSSSASTGVNN